jgi:hypothetical protein
LHAILQKITLDLSEGEKVFLKYSALGRVVVNGLAMAAHVAPFGGSALATALVAVYARAQQVSASAAAPVPRGSELMALPPSYLPVVLLCTMCCLHWLCH